MHSLLETCLVILSPELEGCPSPAPEFCPLLQATSVFTAMEDAVFPPILAEDGQPVFEFSEYYNSYVPAKLMGEMPDMRHHKKLSQISSSGSLSEALMDFDQASLDLSHVAELYSLSLIHI